MLKSVLVSSFILLCTVIIESSILSNISFLPVVPDLVLICSVYFALSNGKLHGEITGFIGGLFLDFISGVPFGFNCLFRTIIGYICGIFFKNIIVSGILVPMISIGLATLVKNLLCFLITVFYPNVSLNFVNLISYNFLYELIFNVILAPLVFKFLKLFNNSILLENKEIIAK